MEATATRTARTHAKLIDSVYASLLEGPKTRGELAAVFGKDIGSTMTNLRRQGLAVPAVDGKWVPVIPNNGGGKAASAPVSVQPTPSSDGSKHPCFEKVLKLAGARRNILLIGPAGCGKTYLASQVAKALGLDFASISCSPGMSEAALLGRAIPNMNTGEVVYQSTEFVRLYENGGVFLCDEMDSADPSVLLVLNQALANGQMTVPNRPG